MRTSSTTVTGSRSTKRANSATTKTTGTETIGTETVGLKVLAETIPGSVEQLSPQDIANLVWSGDKPFELAPWVQFAGRIALFKSEKLDEYVKTALEHVVKGKGMGMTQAELLSQIREGIGVHAWIVGGCPSVKVPLQKQLVQGIGARPLRARASSSTITGTAVDTVDSRRFGLLRNEVCSNSLRISGQKIRFEKRKQRFGNRNGE